MVWRFEPEKNGYEFEETNVLEDFVNTVGIFSITICTIILLLNHTGTLR